MLPHPSVLTADAGQMYEAVGSDTAIKSMLKLADDCSFPCISVMLGKKSIAAASWCQWAQKSGWKTLTKRSVVQAFAFALTCTRVVVGDHILETHGLPTGGLCSKVASSIVLGHSEDKWLRSASMRARLGFAMAFTDWSRLIVACRYVDDIIFISRVFCVA